MLLTGELVEVVADSTDFEVNIRLRKNAEQVLRIKM